MDTQDVLLNRIRQLQHSIEDCARRSGRKADEIKLLLVSKTVPAERILQALASGCLDFGENRVQELLAKKKELLSSGSSAEASKIRWHLIGPLQTNKVRQVLGEAALIHSLDRPELADEIVRQARIKKIPQVDCLIQVNSSGESTKHGLHPDQVTDFVKALKDPEIRIRGLMTIGPLTGDPEKIRHAFRLVQKLRDALKVQFSDRDWGTLSMGMSNDYPIAIEEGANLLRIGSLVFGKRT